MRPIFWILMAGTMLAAGRTHTDPSGFTMELAEGWQARGGERGMVVAQAAGGMRSVLILPILGRTADCGTWLERNLQGGWPAYPQVSDLRVERMGRQAVARFVYRGGQSRATMLCAETSARVGMVYAAAAPVAEFARELPGMVSMLKSFRLQGNQGASVGRAERYSSWTDPAESAWTTPVPEGWRPEGGVRRVSNLDIRSAVRMMSPDGARVIQLNDPRLEICVVPGPQTMTNAAPMGAGRWCPYQTGAQVAGWYVTNYWGRDFGLAEIQVQSHRERPDLAEPHNQESRRNGLGNYQYSFGEIVFRARRNGQPVEGRVMAQTQMFWTPDRSLVQGNYRTIVNGYLGPAGEGGRMAKMLAEIEGGFRMNLNWLMENRRMSRRDAEAILGFQRWSADLNRRTFWETAEGQARRSEAVGDTLLGRVRLKDEQGNRYEAPAGSNYYYFDEEAGKTARRPDEAVLGTERYPGPLVDLRPLEVIR